MAARWQDHILGPDTTANRPTASSVPEHAMYADTDDGVLYINVAGTWTTYRSPATGLSDPTTTLGDLLVRGASTIARLGVGADKASLVTDSGQTLGVKWAALDDSYIAPVAPNDQTGTTYTFVAADAYRLTIGNNASPQTFTIPPNSSVDNALGTSLQVLQKGAGVVSFAAGSGVTIHDPDGMTTSGQWELMQAIQIDTDEWVVSGSVTT